MNINDPIQPDFVRLLRLDATKEMSAYFTYRQDSNLEAISKVDFLLTTITTETACEVVKDCVNLARVLLINIREDRRKINEYLSEINPDFQQFNRRSFGAKNGELYVSDDGYLETTDPNNPAELPDSNGNQTNTTLSSSKVYLKTYPQKVYQPVPVYRTKFFNKTFEYKKVSESVPPVSLVLDKNDGVSTACETDSSPDMKNHKAININVKISEKSIDKITSRKDFDYYVAKWRERIYALNPTKTELLGKFDDYPKFVYFWKNPELVFLLKCQYRFEDGSIVFMQNVKDVKSFYQKQVDLMHILANDVGISFYKAGVPNYERVQRSTN